jgi:hypothetical protein
MTLLLMAMPVDRRKVNVRARNIFALLFQIVQTWRTARTVYMGKQNLVDRITMMYHLRQLQIQ